MSFMELAMVLSKFVSISGTVSRGGINRFEDVLAIYSKSSE